MDNGYSKRPKCGHPWAVPALARRVSLARRGVGTMEGLDDPLEFQELRKYRNKGANLFLEYRKKGWGELDLPEEQ